MTAVAKYLGGVNLPIGTIKQVPTSSFTPNPETISYNGLWVKPGAVYLQSAYPELYYTLGLVNAASFTPRTSSTTSGINALTYGNGTYVYGGAGGAMATSTDAITWTAQTSANYVIDGLAYGSNVFVRTGGSGYTGYSTDAVTWTNYGVDNRTNQTIYTTLNANLYIAAGASIIRTSTDLHTWSSANYAASAAVNFNSSAYNPTANGISDVQEVTYYTPGTYEWTVPAGVGTISAVAVGGGGGGVNNSSGGAGGNGADLRYSSGITVTPGQILVIQAGGGGVAGATTGGDGLPSQIAANVASYSGYFDGEGDYISSSGVTVGTGDITVEFWFYATSDVVQLRCLYDGRSAVTTNTGLCIFQNGLKIDVYGNGVKGSSAANAFGINQWIHCAVVRSSGNCRIYINGTASGSSFAYADNFTSTLRRLGTNQAGNEPYIGYISNLREVTAAVYTGNFTPPTTPLTAIANTSLLTCQSVSFVDNSTNNFFITVNGSAQTAILNPFNTPTLILSAAGGGGGTIAGVNPRSQNGNSSAITGNIGGGNGGVRANNTTTTSSAGGGGAGGYYGTGGAPGVNATPGSAGTGGAGGGGGGGGAAAGSGRGGGVSLIGQGASGAGGAAVSAGSPGSVGAGVYCGGGGGGVDGTSGAQDGGPGGVRIIWGEGRAYPSTNTAPTLSSRYAIPGSGGYIAATADGSNWTVGNSRTTSEFNGAAYGNGTWVAGGAGGVISYSNNGSQWNTLPAADYYTREIDNVLYGGNLYIFSGLYTLKTTTDLKSWSTPNISGLSSATLYSAAYNANTSGNTSPAQQIEYYTPGTYSWTVPAGVGSISAVTVGGGGGGVNSTSGGAGGNGADLRYSSNIAVTPGETLTIVVGAGGHTTYAAPGVDGIPSQIWRGNSTSNSVYVDNNDYYTLINNAALQMSTGNYTMEGWWYPTTLTGFQTLFDKGGQAIGGILIQTGNGNGNIQVYSSNVASTVANITANLSVTTNAWNHIAVVRAGTTLTLYQNGNSVGAVTNAANCNSTATFSMGAIASGANGATGYFSNFRVVKGTAVYTSNFVPPTTQLTAIANTSLLTFQDANILDNSTNNFFIGAEGNVRTTTLSPFGNLTLLLSAAGGGGGTIAATAAKPQNGFSSVITGNIGGGNGGIRTANTTTANTSGGGGTGGYSGAGGVPGVGLAGANAAAGGGGGGGGGALSAATGGAGGGVSLMGERASGTGGAVGVDGNPGSVGAAIYVGGGGPGSDTGTASVSTAGQDGGVRIIWGAGRSYPSTNTAPVYESKYVAVGRLGYITSSVDGNSWIVADSKTTSTINAVTYGNGTYVYGGVSGMIATSTDGANWTARTSGTASAIQALIYAANTYVLGTISGGVSTSTDAITWTARTYGATTDIYALTYGNGLFVAGGTGGQLRTSTDAVTWTARTSGTATRIFGLAYGNGVYVYAGQVGLLGSSTDAITWTVRNSGTSSAFNSVTYGNGLFVASGTGGTETHRYSTDGTTWFSYTSGTSNAITGLTYGNGIFVYVAGGGEVGTSTDGQAWVTRNDITSTVLRAVTYGNGLYVTVGNSGYLMSSTDLKTWVARTSGTNLVLYSVTYGNGVYVYGGTGSTVASSTDTITWRARFVDGNDIYYAATYGNGLFFIAGTSGSELYRYSTDGTEWFSYTSGTSSDLNAVTYGNGLFVAVGNGGVLRTSTNGDRWVVADSGRTVFLYSVTYGNGLYVYGGTSGALSTSTDGTTWTSRTSGQSATIYALTYGNSGFVSGAWSGGLASSTDGITWTSRTSGTSTSIYSLTYGNGVYVYGTINGVTASSTDMITWGDRKSGTTRDLLAAVAPSTGTSIFAGGVGFLGTTANLALNQYSPAYNAATEFYVPAVTATSFGTLQANVAYLTGVTQSIYIKARQ